MGLCADVSRNHQIVDSILELYIASILEKPEHHIAMTVKE